MKKTIVFILFFMLLYQAALAANVMEAEAPVDIVYFYGAGCPHCADFEEFLDSVKDKYNINPVGYEVYQNQSNRELATNMAEQYGETFRGVPMIYIGDKVFVGFSDSIGTQIEDKIKSCATECCDSPLQQVKMCEAQEKPIEKITLFAAVSLALADAVNPCEFAVLTMVLVALLFKDPKNRKNVLLGGFAFTLAIFLTYIIYGVIIIQFFKFIHTSVASISPYIRSAFALVAVFLGLMNIMDYVRYKPGTMGTEMPMSLRPKVKHLIHNITKPSGAFIIGIFVTIFLLPCTMGPYVVAGNLLSSLSILNAIPWLLLYNLIFVLPMIAITLIVYFGYSTVENVSGWKESHIRTLHLVAGLVLVIMGILMLLGYI